MVSRVSATRSVAILLTFILASGAWAAGGHGGSAHGHGTDRATEIGGPGKATATTRTIYLAMFDNRYEPTKVAVKEGETVRFVIENKGEFVHEFSIATAEMHKAHAPKMRMMVDHGVLEPDRINWEDARKMQDAMGHGMHNEPNSALVEPGKSAEIVWTFPKHASLEFACNVPGHYGAGMVGKIELIH